MREIKIEDHLAAAVKTRGGETRKVAWVNHNGAPDRLVLLPGWHVWVELKMRGKTPTHVQKTEHAVLCLAGLHVRVIDTIADVDKLMAEYDNHPRPLQC